MATRRRHRWSQWPMLLAVAALVTALGPAVAQDATGVPPGIGIRLVDAPVDRRDDPRARLYVIDHLNPGASITRTIEVSNGTDEPVRLLTYAAAAELVDGTFKVVEGRSRNELTEWTKVVPSEIDLAVGERRQAKVTITVPADASPGERYAVALAELPAKAASPGSVSVASRVGVRLYISVGPGGEPASDFEVDTLTARREPDGTPVVSAQVHNTGGRALDMSGELRLTEGPGSLSAGPFPAELGTSLAIGARAPVEIALDKQLPAGPWKATLTLRSGLLERTVVGTIRFPEPGETSAPVKPRPSGARSGPPLFIGVGALGGVIGLLLFFFWKRRKKDDEEEDDADEAVPAAPEGPR